MADDPFAKYAEVPAPGAADPFAKYAEVGKPAGAAPSPIVDMAKGLGAGVVNGISETVQLPATLSRLARAGADKVFDGVESGARWLVGAPQVTAEQQAERAKLRERTGLGGLEKYQDQLRSAVNLYDPQTVPGQYAKTVGEFLPGMAGGTSEARLGAKVAQFGGDVLLPAIFSETAGQATKGTALEPWARAVAAVVPNAGAAAVRSHATAPDRTIQAATRGMTPEQWDAAAAMQQQGARVGVPLSGPEAVSQVTGGASKLPDVQRVVEGSVQGGAVTGPFYAQRPAQVQQATNDVLDFVAPRAADPYTLGPRAAEAAQGSIDDVQRSINDTTRPAYRAAEAHVMDPVDFEPMMRDPAFRASLAAVRNDPVLGPTLAELPDNSVRVIDSVTKGMQSRGTALANSANPGFNSEVASRYSTGAAEARDMARDPARGGVQAYDDALSMQEQARRQNLDPLRNGPTGAIAEVSGPNATRTAYDTLLPEAPLSGGQDALAATATRLQQQDPGLPGQLARQALEDRFASASGDLVGGQNQYGGARFASEVAGTPQQRETLNAVLGAPMKPGVPERVNELLDVLRATGQRRPQGSATAFNQQIQRDVSEAPLGAQAAVGVKSGGTSVLRNVGDAAQRAWLGKNTNTLAQLFTDPRSVEMMRNIASRELSSPVGQAFVRQLFQSADATRPR